MDNVREYFIVETDPGNNWLMCFGTGNDCKVYYVTTNHMHGSDAMTFIHDAPKDAALVARLLNEYYTRKLHPEDA